MIEVNGHNITVYILDTRETIFERIAVSLGTIPKFIEDFELPFITDMITDTIKIKTSTIPDIKRGTSRSGRVYGCCL